MKRSLLDIALGRNKPKMNISTTQKPTMLASSANNDDLFIEIIGDIGDWWLGNTAEDFLSLLAEHKDKKNIYVKLHSLGGYVTDGIAIYNELLLHPAKIIITVVGMAGSICSVIAMAGDEIRMLPASFIMIHNGDSYPASYKADDLEKAAAQQRQINLMAANIYVARTGLTLEKVTAMMDAETWITSEQALELGFADKILPETPSDLSPAMLSSMSAPLPFSTLDHLKHVPSALMSIDKIKEKIIEVTPSSKTLTPGTTMTTPVVTPVVTPASLQLNTSDSVEIIQLCRMSGEKPERATAFIESGNSAAEVRATLYAEKTKSVEAIPAVNNVGQDEQITLSGDDVSAAAPQAVAKSANPLLSFATTMNAKNKNVG